MRQENSADCVQKGNTSLAGDFHLNNRAKRREEKWRHVMWRQRGLSIRSVERKLERVTDRSWQRLHTIVTGWQGREGGERGRTQDERRRQLSEIWVVQVASGEPSVRSKMNGSNHSTPVEIAERRNESLHKHTQWRVASEDVARERGTARTWASDKSFQGNYSFLLMLMRLSLVATVTLNHYEFNVPHKKPCEFIYTKTTEKNETKPRCSRC